MTLKFFTIFVLPIRPYENIKLTGPLHCHLPHSGWTDRTLQRGLLCFMPAVFIPLEKVQERLLLRNFQIVGDFKNTQKIAKVKCLTCSHEWRATPNDLTRKKNASNCPKCSMRERIEKSRRPKSDIQSILAKRNILIVGEYLNLTVKSVFKCLDSEHTCTANP